MCECGVVGVWVWNDRGASSRKMCQMGQMCLRLVKGRDVVNGRVY